MALIYSLLFVAATGAGIYFLLGFIHHEIRSEFKMIHRMHGYKGRKKRDRHLVRSI